MKIKVPIAGTVGKSVQFDPAAGARAEAAVAALAAQISAGLGGSIRHSSLQGLQVGDDHPQYTGNAFPETVTGQWNFSTIPFIQGDTLAEYIEDVVGGSFFDFLQDTSSVVWTYHETANQLEANVPPEFVQDTVGAMLVDTTSIDLTYNDGAGTITAAIIDEYVQDLVGAMATDSTSIDFTYNDGAGTLTAAIIDEYVQDLVGAMATDSTSIDFTYNDGAGTLTAAVIYANPSASVGLSAVNGSAATAMRSDAAPALSQSITPTWTGNHTWNDNVEGRWGTGNDLRLYHDGTDSHIRNDTGSLLLQYGSSTGLGLDASGNVYIPIRAVIGATSNAGPDGANAAFGVNGTSSNSSVMDFSRFENNNSGPNLAFGKSRGATIGAHTIVQADDIIGQLFWSASNGTGFNTCALMRVTIDGTPGTSNDMPGRFRFFTTPDGSATIVERFNICANGAIKCVALSADPSGAEDGMVYYNSSTNKLKVRAGGAWVDLH